MNMRLALPKFFFSSETRLTSVPSLTIRSGNFVLLPSRKRIDGFSVCGESSTDVGALLSLLAASLPDVSVGELVGCFEAEEPER